MRSVFVIFCFGLSAFLSNAQVIISGKVVDAKNVPLQGVNVFLDGTYDGATTNDKGVFSFSTDNSGMQKIVASFVSFVTYSKFDEVSNLNALEIVLKEDVNTLDAVVISAGTFTAGDNSKVTALKPLDVVTTASALGDPIAAFQTLPGTSTVAEDGRLFVRGGDAEETQIFIDDIRVFTPYVPSANNTPTRGRYSPFLFDGMTFSTGGYSAEYGQALSSVLLLNTINEPEQEKTDIGIMSLGGAVGNTQIWGDTSLSLNTSYINLGPYIKLFDDRNDWKDPYEMVSGEAVFRKKYENGIFKLYTAFDTQNFDLIQNDINYEDGIRFKLKNYNTYLNTSYRGVLNNNWSLFTGLSYTNGKSNIHVFDDEIEDTENSVHAKIKLKHHFSNRFKFMFGSELLATKFDEAYTGVNENEIEYGFRNTITSVFSEADYFFSKNLAVKAGLRLENSELLKDFSIAPRLSLAYKLNKTSQMSIAYGDFKQNPSNQILKFEQDLKPQATEHYILNFQNNKDGKIFRAEAYYKNYRNLVKYDTQMTQFNSVYSNDGYGIAKGLDVFWRDNKSVKNLDYWVSYSFLDTERDYKNYETAAQPNFVNKHNLSLVGKYWIENWKSQLGVTFSHASGRTYTNPNLGGFLNQKTKSYNNVSLSWAYLISQQKILFFSANNILGISNINGYQYADAKNQSGIYDSQALRPAADRFFFIGFFWTISEKGNDNQLDNL